MNESGRKAVNMKDNIYSKYIKRIVDMVLSGVALICLMPVFIIISVLVAVKLGRPIIFTQARTGLHGKTFRMYKFRTMTNETDSEGNLLPSEQRMTKVGRILRATSLDELPELINIFKGEMSIIGPRPLVERYCSVYTLEEMKRHDVRPGLTGLAQVNGRSFISWEEIFDYDLRYVNNVSLLMDIKIILATIHKVFVHENVADLSKAQKGKDGKYWIEVDGKKFSVHGALDEERRGKQ